jgi:hypothetical protein
MKPLGKNHQTYAPWPDVSCFSGPINRPLPLFILHKFQTPRGCQSVPRVIPKCLSVFCECVCEAFASFGTFVRRNSCGFVLRR